jgi:hypothetical protein
MTQNMKQLSLLFNDGFAVLNVELKVKRFYYRQPPQQKFTNHSWWKSTTCFDPYEVIIRYNEVHMGALLHCEK